MLSKYLEAEGFNVVQAPDGRVAISEFRRSIPDVVILDVAMPDVDGLEVLRQIRAESSVFVIMLTAKAEEVDRVVGLTMGADDYVTKPFSPRELVARLHAVLRRDRPVSNLDEEGVLAFDGLVVNAATREVVVDGVVVDLSALEFDLLSALAERPGRVFTRSHLLERVWGWDHFGTDRVVDVHIANIRKALSDDHTEPRFIATVRGVGYRFIANRVMRTPRTLRSRLAVSHLLVVAVGAITVLGVAVLVTPSFLRTHLGTMSPSMPAMSSEMTVDLQDQLEVAFAQILAVAVPVSVGVALVAAYVASSRLLAPIDAVRSVVRRLAAGEYGKRLRLPQEEELAALAVDINHLAITLDQTERRRMQLLNDVSHELRTPLTTIEGYMEAILDEVMEPTPEIIASVIDETRRLKRLASDVSLLSRAEEGALVLEPGSVDVGALATQVLHRLAPQFDDAGVRTRLLSSAPALVFGDRDRLIQVLTNLIGNALTHTPTGGIVSVAWESVGHRVETTITDSGRGIRPEDLDRVFDRFYRVDPSAPGGTGVGLTIARRIARLHGGDVTVASAGVGSGSVFTLELPSA